MKHQDLKGLLDPSKFVKDAVVRHSRIMKTAYRSPEDVYVATSAAFSDPVRAALTRRHPLPGFRRDARFIVGGICMRFFIGVFQSLLRGVPEVECGGIIPGSL